MTRARAWLLCCALVAGCGARAPVTDCVDDAASYDVAGSEPLTTFHVAPGGAGRFGRWVVGPTGLPEYAYTLDELHDPAAGWTLSDGSTRHDHWHLVANGRIQAAVANDGYVQVLAEERGPELLDRFDPASGNFGGGYSIVDGVGDAPWSSAYAWRPADAQAARAFGVGYARNVTCRRELRVTHTLSAPPGDRPFVVDEVELANRTGAPLSFTHYEVWDVNRHFLDEELADSGALNPGGPALVDATRAALDAKFTTSAGGDALHARIRNRLTDASAAPALDAPAAEDLYPPDIFLATLDGGADRFITDGAAFWGPHGAPDRPGDLAAGALAPTGGLGQPGILVAERSVTVPPHQATTLRYAFGNVAEDAPLPDLGAAELDRGLEARRAALVYVDAGDDALQREMAWHAYYLDDMGGRSDYFEHAVVNQGSAYYYLQGLDGAVRDFVFSAAALTYVDPARARETLLTCARMRRAADGALVYATSGFGELTGVGIHEQPSDLDLFFWWGVAEYVFATGDRSLLDDVEPYWPKGAAAPQPLSEHLRVAARHLLDVVGVGAHGLIRVGDGDWDDGIVQYAKNRDTAIKSGESVANTAMAVLVAPWAAALLQPTSPATADELRAFAAGQAQALDAQFTGRWYRRAWLGPDEPFGDDAIFALPNAFALAADAAPADRAAELVTQMKTLLEDPSTTGLEQSSLYSGTNPAITALAVWGYAHAAPERAWAALRAMTMATKADAYPDLWYGIWSGPDAQYTSAEPAQAGQTWSSLATAMTDFPVMNSNQHAGPLLALWRAAGIEPVVRDGVGCLRIAPAAAVRLDAPLVRVEADGSGGFSGVYRPIVDGHVCLVLGAPETVVHLDVRRGVAVPFSGATRTGPRGTPPASGPSSGGTRGGTRSAGRSRADSRSRPGSG